MNLTPNLRLLLFALIVGCYFIITLHIINVNQEGCYRNPYMPATSGQHHGPNDDSGQDEVKVTHRDLMRGSDNGWEKNPGLKSAGSNLGPVGKALAVQRHKKPNLSRSIYDHEVLSPLELLRPEHVPNIVHMIWCGRRWFEFHHYMAVISVIKYLRPDNIFFYYDSYPIQDYWLYNTWIEELRELYPFFHVQQLEAWDNGCTDHSTPNITFMYRLLTANGGMYINEHTILSDFPANFRRYDFLYAFNPSTMEGLVMAKRGLPGRYSRVRVILSDRSLNSTELSCATVNSFNKAKQKPHCIIAKNVFYPADIWEEQSKFAGHIRTLFYGRPEPVDAVPSYDELIPNIAHVVWIGGGEMDYLFYLGVLSLVYVAEVEAVFIHGNAPPSGPLWARLKDHPKVRLIYRQTPKTVYGTRVHVLSHVTDVWRVDFMIRYGGIYVDTDTVFVRKLDEKIRGYDAVGAYDWTYWNPPFPDTINFGVAIGKRNATYWHAFQQSMKWFIDKDWSWNGLRQPYRIKERHPDWLKIEPHLQVICYEYKCHPTWWPNYHNESVHHLNSPSITDWRKDVYAFHWTLPTPPELLSEENLLTSNTMFSEIGRYILEKAGLLAELKKKYKVRQSTSPQPPGANPQPRHDIIR